MQKFLTDTYYSGLSGLHLPVPKYLFPPLFKNTSRLTYYSSFFNSIEFNNSFYKIPKAATIHKWADEVSEKFRFTFKLWKGITHTKGLHFNKDDVSAFLKSISAVQEKKGCLLIQFPPGLGSEYIAQLDRLLQCIKDSDTKQAWKVAVEFRNKSWYCEKVYDILNFYGAAIVIQDIPKSATPFLHHKSDFIYIRFHGPTGNYRDSYSEDFLEEYTTYIREWIEEGKTIYTYFNNTMGEAFNNLITLNDFFHNQNRVA